jgi:hypothetical protein
MKTTQPNTQEPVAWFQHKYVTPEWTRECMVYCDKDMATGTPLHTHPAPLRGYAGEMPTDQEDMDKAANDLAPWLSAALDDPQVCAEYKSAINAWFNAAMPAPLRELTDEQIDIISQDLGMTGIPLRNRDLLQFARDILNAARDAA